MAQEASIRQEIKGILFARLWGTIQNVHGRSLMPRSTHATAHPSSSRKDLEEGERLWFELLRAMRPRDTLKDNKGYAR